MNKKDKKSESPQSQQGAKASPGRDEKTLPELLMKLSKLGVPMAPEDPPEEAPELSPKEAKSWREMWEATGNGLPDWVDGKPCHFPHLGWSVMKTLLWYEVTPKEIVEAYRRDRDYWD